MLKASQVMRDAANYSQTLSLHAEITRGGDVIYNDLKISSGSLTGDRTSNTRYNAKVTLAVWPWEVPDIDNQTCRIRITRGVTSLGYIEELQVFQGRVDEVTRGPGGEVSLDCSGLEAYIVDGRFLSPRTPPRGTSTTGEIVSLIREILPDEPVRVECTTNRAITASAPWARERWDAIDSLSASIGAETFSDARGFVIRDTPSLSVGQPVVNISEGDHPLVVDINEKSSRDQVYNAASVSGQSSDPNQPPVWGWAYINDPNDPLYFYGPFGQVPIFYSSQFFSTTAQCNAYAAELLVTAQAKNETLTFTTPPSLWWLEVGDLAQLDRLNGETAVVLLQKMNGGLGYGDGIKFDTMSSKVAARLEDD